MEKLIKNLGLSIAEKIDAEQIFVSKHKIRGRNNYHLTILATTPCGVKLTELNPFVDMIIAEFPYVTYVIHQRSEIAKQLSAGHIYFHCICTPVKQLYKKEDLKDFPDFDNSVAREWLEDSQRHFDNRIAKTHAFMEGANFYFARGNNTLSLFMLHQVIELTYRAIELAILTHEKKSHDLKEHQKYLQLILPQLPIIFCTELPKEAQLLNVVNRAYSAVRYESNFEVDDHFVKVLFKKVERVQSQTNFIVKQLFDEFISRYSAQ